MTEVIPAAIRADFDFMGIDSRKFSFLREHTKYRTTIDLLVLLVG